MSFSRKINNLLPHNQRVEICLQYQKPNETQGQPPKSARPTKNELNIRCSTSNKGKIKTRNITKIFIKEEPTDKINGAVISLIYNISSGTNNKDETASR